ncbi:hypothetical protein PG993_013058 [Apiospora rasikravindrae]|uniref:Uncharacterized protein n=1 Tax=Apiospora rasikravindrae TaxID=990691 RepID=A0ABR1RWL8_9PEZI
MQAESESTSMGPDVRADTSEALLSRTGLYLRPFCRAAIAAGISPNTASSKVKFPMSTPIVLDSFTLPSLTSRPAVWTPSKLYTKDPPLDHSESHPPADSPTNSRHTRVSGSDYAQRPVSSIDVPLGNVSGAPLETNSRTSSPLGSRTSSVIPPHSGSISDSDVDSNSEDNAEGTENQSEMGNELSGHNTLILDGNDYDDPTEAQSAEDLSEDEDKDHLERA